MGERGRTWLTWMDVGLRGRTWLTYGRCGLTFYNMAYLGQMWVNVVEHV